MPLPGNERAMRRFVLKVKSVKLCQVPRKDGENWVTSLYSRTVLTLRWLAEEVKLWIRKRQIVANLGGLIERVTFC